MDYFETLSNLKIAEVLTTELIAQSSNKLVRGELTIYLFDSEKYSRPHRVQVDKDFKIQEIALTIPKVQIQAFRVQQESLGNPESVKRISETETILGYPTQGLSFLVNETKLPIEVVKIKPVSNQVFVEQRLNLITIVPQYKQIIQATNQSANNFSNPIGQPPIKSSSSTWILISLGLLLTLLVCWLWFYFRRPVTAQPQNQPPQFPPQPN